MLEEELSGVYVHSIMIGANIVVDTESGFFRDTNRQISEVSVYILRRDKGGHCVRTVLPAL